MRRVLALILVALGLLGGAAAFGALAFARSGPETLRQRAQERLSAVLGTEVELGAVSFGLSRAGLVVAADGLGAWPAAGGPALRAERLALRLDPWTLVAGDVEIDWVALEGVALRLRREGEGLTLDLPRGAAPPQPPRAGDGAGGPSPVERVLAQVPQLELRQGRAVVAAGPGGAPELALEELDGSIRRRWLRGGAAFELRGALRAEGDAAGRFAVSGSVDEDEGFAGGAEVDELALRALASLAPEAARAALPEGRASGRVDVRGGTGAPLRVRFDLEAPRLRVPLRDAPVDLREVHLGGTATASRVGGGATRWTLEGRARTSDLAAPVGATAFRSASGTLRVEEVSLGGAVEIGELAPLLAALPETARERGREILRRVRGGRLLDARVGWRPAREGGGLVAGARVEALVLEAGAGRVEGVSGTLAIEGGVLTLFGVEGRIAGDAAALAELWSGPQRERVRAVLTQVGGARVSGVELRWPLAQDRRLRDVELRGRVDEAVLRAGAQSRLEGLSGRVDLRGGALTLSGVGGRLDGQPLPVLDATIAGVEHLGDGLRCVRPAPVGALAGRRPLLEWLRGPPDRPRGPPSWQRVRVEADWLAHPALGCVVDGLTGVASPVGTGGLRVAIEGGLWAGLGIEGSAEHLPGPSEAVRLDLRLGAPGAGARTRAPAGIWGRGRFELETQKLGSWKARGARGRFRLEGEGLALEDATIRLAPGPQITPATISLDLDRADEVPFRANGETSGGEFGDLLLALSDTPEPAVSGPFVGAISLQGALRPGRPILAASEGGFSLHVRDGVIRQRFRLFLAVAMVSETLNPFRERGTIRFRALDVEGTLRAGSWQVETAQVDGPALRAYLSGRVGAVSPHEVEAVMGLFFFRTVDRAIGAVPLLSRMLLGEDRNLLGTYVALSGPWIGVQASVLPVKSLASGPASIVLEGVPTALQQGVRVIERMLAAPAAPAEMPPPGAPVAAPPRGKADS